MPFDRRKANEYKELVRDMGFGSESKRSLNQQESSKLVKEKAQLPRANSRLKNQGKLIAKNGSTYPFANLSGEEGQDQIRSNFIHSKSLGACQGQPRKGKSAKEDELVRYMSNLPGYLQRVDSGESLQEKAFNVGVLDWARLEKWKYHQKHIPIKSGNDVSSTGTSSSMKTNTKSSALSSSVPKDAAANKGKQHRLNSSSLRSSHKDGLFRGAKPFTEKVRHFQDIETASKSSLDQQKKTSKTYKSIGTTSSDVNFEKEKKNELNQKITSEMGNTSSNMGNHEVSPFPKEFASVSDGGAKNRVEKRQDIDADKKDLDKKNTSEAELSSSISRDYPVSLGSRKTSGAEGDKTKKKEARCSDLDLARQISPGKRKNIILLLPRSARNSFHEERQELLDGTLDQASRNSFSYDLLQKVRCDEPGSEVPHSCPLSSGIVMNPETLGVEPSSGESYGSACSNNSGSLRSEGHCSAERKTKSQDADVEALKILEEEMAELATRNSRTTSPNRRFSFSLSRMSRSFSFKEGSNVPLLSSNYVSVKSGPVRSDSSGFLDDTNREVNGHNRTRSSPLRRMLDPLLKSRGLSSLRFTDTVQPSKQSLNPSTPRPVNSNESLQEEKCDSPMIPALLQLTIKNGLPLFRFVVDNGSNMLATTMKSLAPSAKGGAGLNYIFSSVSEIKKKSGSWISHGNKEKNCGFIYNIIGQMKISSSHSSDFTAQDPSNQYLLRESVLFGVEQRQADQASGKFTPSTELAAVIIKMSGDGTDVELSDKDIQKKGFTECLAMDECPFNSMENASFDIATVILPGGVHSLPNKGIPSPLIDRWKSGGLCDCGGWDVGCKLRILSNEKKRCCKFSRTCQACLNPNRLELYAQGEAQNNRPIFSLVPHKNGIYAIEFSSSITALQAFFISVTVVSCQTSSDLPELNEGKVMKDTMLNGSHGMENKPTIVLANVPAKYAPNPPHSPVGRV